LIYAFSPDGVACLEAVLATDPLLAFDIDGTLAPIVELPHEARLPDDVQSALADLARRFSVAIITGRAVDDARQMLSFEPRHLIGNHGAEGLPGWGSRSQAFARIVRDWREALAGLGELHATGVSLEDKAYSMSLHFRQAASPVVARRAIERSIACLQPPPRVVPGKAVVNLLPPGAPDKGDALRALIDATRCPDVLYVGDDDTDETVFGLQLPGVLTVRVEPAADSAAALFLRDQSEVLTLIQYIGRDSRRGARPLQESPSR
jgi:trehalose 6-phosphate phosphatase